MEGTKGEPMVPKAGIQSGVEVVQPADEGERTIIVTRELFPKHPPSGSAFQGQEDYETYLEKYTGLELTITEEKEQKAKEAGYSSYLDSFADRVVND